MDCDYYCGRGIELKRAGKYAEAKEAYYDAIKTINDVPTVVKPFSGLAKVCYLNNDRNEAIIFNLISIHLHILKCEKNSYKASALKKDCPPDYIIDLDNLHRDAIYLLSEPHCRRHLAHAVIDLGGLFDIYEVNSNYEYVSIYKNAVAGMSDYQNEDIESEYGTTGTYIAEELIKWDMIDNNNISVIDLINLYSNHNL